MHIFTMGAVASALSLIVGILMIRTGNQLVSSDEPAEEAKEDAKLEHKRPWQTFKEVIKEPTLWRLIVLIALILGVRAIYVYNGILMPKYWERTIGEDAQIGVLNTINPIGIAIGLILFIPIANRFNVFNMLVYGAMLSCFSLLPMALPWEWYGLGIAKTHYVMAILCMVILTIGEIIWSPKLNEYTAAIAPKGQEGIYLGLSLLPWFLAKTVASYFSGDMLDRWSPEKVSVNGANIPLQQAMMNGQISYWDTPAAMWLWLCVYAFGGCVLALLLRGWLTKGAHWKVDHK
jgi:MFS family permease